MISLVLFTTRASSKLASDLESAGFRVSEALAISEVLNLCESEPVDVVVIDLDVEEERAKVVQEHHTAIRLKLDATLEELVEELWRLFPDKASRIQ